jgi:hypothetical protein
VPWKIKGILIDFATAHQADHAGEAWRARDAETGTLRCFGEAFHIGAAHPSA